MKKHLVTGGTGFIGSALVRRLVRDGFSVRVLDNGSRGSAENLADVAKKIEFQTCDIRDPGAVRTAAEGCETIWHLAAVNGTENFYRKPGIVLEVGVKGIVNILDACRQIRAKDLIVVSSSEVYQTPPKIPTDETAPLIVPDPLNPRFSYGASKIISEIMALHCEKEVVGRTMIVRPHNIYGPAMGWEHVVPQLITRLVNLKARSKKVQLPIQGTGNETRAFCFVSDMIDGLLATYHKGRNREIYHVGNPVETPIRNLAMEIATAMSVECTVLPGQLTEGSTGRRCPDISKVRTLGFSPQVSLKDGILKTVQWYLQAIQNKGERAAA